MITFEFDQELGRKYYEELYYIACNSERFIKNPRRKVGSPLFDFIWVFSVMIIAMAGCFLILRDPGYTVFRTVLTTIYAVFILYYGLIAFHFYRTIKKMQTYHGKRFFSMDETKLELKTDEKDVSMELSRVSAFIMNKNSVCFLPKDSKGVVFGLPVFCKDEIVQYLEKTGKGSLIIRSNQ